MDRADLPASFDRASPGKRLTLSVIMPVRNGGDDFARCLDAVRRGLRAGDELIVVDDGSDDASRQIALDRGARAISIDRGPLGPAAARNAGAQVAAGDILVFVDADVLVHSDTLELIEDVFRERPDIDAVFGSYDDHPPDRSIPSLYKNLLHHYVHQHGRRKASTFWAGCGAVRREAFAAVGGFSPSYARPSIEDIDLGMRLRASHYRILLCPEIQATHLKRWTFESVVRTDIFSRAIPWSRAIAASGHTPKDLNLGLASRVSALLAWLLLACLASAIFKPLLLLGALGCALGMAVLDASLIRFFASRGGPGFAAGAAGMHFLYYLYSSAVYTWIVGPRAVARRGLPVLLAATLIKGLVWSASVPPWHVPDEPQHFLYAQTIERQGTLAVHATNIVPVEAVRLARIAGFWPSHKVPVEPLPMSGAARERARIDALNDPRIKRATIADPVGQVVWTPTFFQYHPPGYYAFVSLAQAIFEGKSIVVRVFVSRLATVLLALVVVFFAHGIGRSLWPCDPIAPLLLATLVSYQPMLTFHTASVSNEAGEVAAGAALLYGLIRCVQDGFTPRRIAGVSIALALGLMTRMSFLAMLLPCAAALVRGLMLARRAGQPAGRLVALALGLPLVLCGAICGWWYRSAFATGGNSMVSAYGHVKPPSLSLVRFVSQTTWFDTYHMVIDNFWGGFGYRSWLGYPRPLMMLILAVVAVGVAMTLRRAVRGRLGQLPSLLLLALVPLGTFLFYSYIDYRVRAQVGGAFVMRGQYFLGSTIPLMAWILAGAWSALRLSARPYAAVCAALAMMLLNGYALFGLILPVELGTASFATMLARAAALQPVSAEALAACAAIWVALSLLVLLALSFAAPEAAPEPRPQTDLRTLSGGGIVRLGDAR